MSQPEALRLAQALNNRQECEDEAADELRRLHTENERLHQINQSHEMKLSVRGYEIQIADLEAQRDALLKALKEAMGGYTEFSAGDREILRKCRAAIKAVEGVKK